MSLAYLDGEYCSVIRSRAIQGNPASRFRANLWPTAPVVSIPASATTDRFDVRRVTGRPLDEDTQYGNRQSPARHGRHGMSLDKISH
jgi:hypothetical protein